MIYKTYRATNPVRWRDGDGWQVGWRLYLVGWHTAGAVNRWWVRSPNDRLALVSVWGSPEPIFVSEDELEEMPMRQEEKSTSLDAKPGTWESVNWKVPPEHQAAHCIKAPEQPAYQCTIQPLEAAKPINIFGEGCFISELQLTAARAEANDLMQRLTESQQEVAKVGIQNHSLRLNTSALERDNQLLERDRDEARQELAEVKAERDRLAEQVEAVRKNAAETIEHLQKKLAFVVSQYEGLVNFK